MKQARYVADAGAVTTALLLMTAGTSMTTYSEDAAVRRLYTAERVAAMQSNVREHSWARARQKAVLERAEPAAALPLSELAAWVPDPRIPRAAYVHETGCPNCGLEVRKFGNYPWLISGGNPWKVTCPSCHSVYPSNDFQAFVESDFQDRSLLTGDHPDDGFGWKSPDHPQKYWFVAWYNKWMVKRRLLPAIEDLGEAYVFTGDRIYAEKCALLLWQLATYYPDYDYAKQSRYGLEVNPNYNGRLDYHTWECFTVDVCARAYDAISPAFGQPLAELEAYTGASTEAVQTLIQEQLLRSMAREVVNETKYIAGNYGMHQKGLLEIAAVLQGVDGTPDSQAMIDWILNNKEYDLYTFMPLYDALYNLVYRDGTPFESPGYNLHWVVELSTIGELLRLNGIDPFEVPRMKKLYDWPLQMLCAGSFTPALGDSGNISNRGSLIRENIYSTAFRVYGEPRYAKALQSVSPSGGQDLWLPPISQAVAEAAARYDGELGYDSQNLAGYGLAILQHGGPSNPFAASLFYGRFHGHHKRDKMHLDIFAQDCSMIPNFGYPETANANDPRRAGFFWNTLSHNTVVVDATMQENARGRCLSFDAGPVCQFVDAENSGVYSQCSEYRRSVLTVDAVPGRPYVVDVFRVEGGRQHDWFVHGTHSDVVSNLGFSAPRSEGTFAGADVEYGRFYDDARLDGVRYGSVSYFGYRGSGYQFLFNVREASMQPGATVRWDIVGSGDRAVSLVRATPGAFLKAHLVGSDEQVFLCDGRPQQNRKGTPETVPFLVRRRTGENLRSTFVTVFEPGRNTGVLDSVERVPCQGRNAVLLRIRCADGRLHVVFQSPEGMTGKTDGVDIEGQTGFVALDADGNVDAAAIFNGGTVRVGEWSLAAPPAVDSTVVACDYANNTVTMADAVPDTTVPVGATALLGSEQYGTTAVVKASEDSRNVSFGAQSPIASRAVVTRIITDERVLMTSTHMPFALPGMHVTNEAMRPVAKVAAVTSGRIVCDRPVSESDFTDSDGDGIVHAYLMEFGPGDRIRIPTSVRTRRNTTR